MTKIDRKPSIEWRDVKWGYDEPYKFDIPQGHFDALTLKPKHDCPFCNCNMLPS